MERCSMTSSRVVDTQLENSKLMDMNKKLLERVSDLELRWNHVAEEDEQVIKDVESTMEKKLASLEKTVMNPLVSTLKESEANNAKLVSYSQKLKSERNDLRKRVSQLLSQVNVKNEENEKLHMELTQIQSKHEESIQKLKLQYEQKILQLNTKINAERNASYSNGGQTAIDMYKRKLQAAELQIRELKKSVGGGTPQRK
ncbi:hypothetical protein C9374_008666 [Naegleria lovaniensis]|uniref:Uncharacterized protein n=1 Tax=Naegleria lovaniensis TaxID=51637 RepID=A0AA88KKP9_NAELO|nr:uncharacterized protein C9374_008666 [Naegleria lovaniensis]KAG2378044.1 hypothetical protein C9374_008666 [Naegleria lovaniensis]